MELSFDFGEHELTNLLPCDGEVIESLSRASYSNNH